MEEFKNQLLEVVNNVKLPPEAIYFVVKDFYRDIIDTYEQYKLMKEEQAKESAPKTDKEEE